MTTASVVIVVVTHNRREDLRRCLAALRAQTFRDRSVLVVDNASSDGTRELLQGAADVDALSLAHNLGGAGGFRVGFEHAVLRKPVWIWVMDDDSVPEPDALETLMDTAGSTSPDVGGILPSVVYAEDIVAGYRRASKPDAPGAERDWGPFVGALFRCRACETVAPVRDDFFISNDDTDYCLRLRLAGWRLLAQPSAVIRHPGLPPAKSYPFPGITRTIDLVAPWRDYYDARNRLIVDLATRGTIVADPRSLPTRAFHEFKYYVLLVLADKENGKQRMLMRLAGHLAAVLGRTGSTVRPGQRLPWRAGVTRASTRR
jgi:rhamnopyranosyl-N-acetylglucosaminyl-diphospho-decaprenol beta-1,3/1,4-galactofuranosyltransferase